jgi:hypothetical protein
MKSEPDCLPQSPSQSPSASLKRRRSEEPGDLGEKRQRVASFSTADEDMGALFAQAAAAAARHIEESSNDTVQNAVGAGQCDHDKSCSHSGDLTPESRLLARALSLPMLESLVSRKTAPKIVQCQRFIGHPDPHYACERTVRRDYQNNPRTRIRAGTSVCHLKVTI